MAHASPSHSTPSKAQLAYTLAVLFALNFMNFYDRQVVGAVGEKIKQEWQLSDGQLASLTTAFVLVYALVGIPFGRLADTTRRRVLLSGGVAVWSAFTALSGAAGSFSLHFLARMGVGIGEASLAPTANALIAALFPVEKRARAISIFMLGLPLGLGCSYLISGLVAKATGGWRPALYVAALPGVVLAVLAWFITEPVKGTGILNADGPVKGTGILNADAPVKGTGILNAAAPVKGTEILNTDAPVKGTGILNAAAPVKGTEILNTADSIRLVLRVRAMWWIIASGALMNLVLYAVSAFSTSFYLRYHGLDIDIANRFNALVFGVGGGIGMLIGGVFGDRAARGGAAGRLRHAMIGAVIATPLFWIALEQPRGSAWRFAVCLMCAVIAIYQYYSTVYAAIHDLVPPGVRGMAMSVYFFVFYVFTALGLIFFGTLSDALAARALATGVSAAESRALGLHDAMYTMPLFCGALVLVLLMAVQAAAAEQRRVA